MFVSHLMRFLVPGLDLMNLSFRFRCFFALLPSLWVIDTADAADIDVLGGSHTSVRFRDKAGHHRSKHRAKRVTTEFPTP
jgi:hypothetical protein